MMVKLAAVGRKLVLVVMDQSEGCVSKSLCHGWEGLVTVVPAHLRVLEAYRSWRDGRLQPLSFYAD